MWNKIPTNEFLAFHGISILNMGGLWGAGVKSTKYNLKRIVENASLSYDEFETILVQIEACMNSRPLTQVNDTSDTLVLTPAHFLVQGTLNDLPERNHKRESILFKLFERKKEVEENH